MILKDALLLGITGSFGSGCTTFGKALQVEMGYDFFSLSDFVKQVWLDRNPPKKIEEAPRWELQKIGNELREKNGDDFLAIVALREARKPSKRYKKLVFDSIRNTSEIKAFRESYPNFFLIAVDAFKRNRHERVKNHYIRLSLPENQFDSDDERDKNEEGNPHGQQVRLCVDEADVIIGNDRDCPNETSAIRNLAEKTEGVYMDLISGKEPRTPQPDESYMSIAYSASLLSKCIKRQVGAVLLDEDGSVLSIGYNENPKGKKPCIEEYKMCYRDTYKQKLFRDLRNQQCPSCHKFPLGDLKPPYHCPYCHLDLDRFYVRDKALARCTALHAEEKAIINADGHGLVGSTLYVTTFPCFMCSHKIMDVEISNIIYCEPYPDTESARILKDMRNIHVERFEGVKSKAYFRLFGSWRKVMETRFS